MSSAIVQDLLHLRLSVQMRERVQSLACRDPDGVIGLDLVAICRLNHANENDRIGHRGMVPRITRSSVTRSRPSVVTGEDAPFTQKPDRAR